MIPAVLLLLVRFTDGSISSGNRIILGYDEAQGHFQFIEERAYEFQGIDGPYIIDKEVIRVSADHEIVREPLTTDSILVEVNNTDKDLFWVPLRASHATHSETYAQPKQLIALSDIEGNFNALSSLLLTNKVIDAQYRWIYGEGHLVLVGDFVDRGENVIPVLWLIYKLEAEAESAGGKVHFILGNHELMNVQGDFRYAQSKYHRIARELGGFEDPKTNYKLLFSENSELGKWMRSKNAMEQIGKYLFVHAGISPDILKYEPSLKQVNESLRRSIDQKLIHHPQKDSLANFVQGRFGPLWYRGLVIDYKYYDKIKGSELKEILNFYQAGCIVIGHTVVDRVSYDYDGRVLRLDVKHGTDKASPKTQGVLMVDEQVYRIDAAGGHAPLKSQY